MNELRFDENLAIREVLDDIVGMVARREKLIRSANQQAEKSRDDRMAQHVKKLEGLMSEFIILFAPILDKVRKYGERLRESISDSETFLKSLAGIIEAGKTIEGTSATLAELERDADGVQVDLQQSAETLDKIEDLFKSTKQYGPGSAGSSSDEPKSYLSTPRRRRPRAKKADTDVSRSYLLPGSGLSSYQPAKSQH